MCEGMRVEYMTSLYIQRSSHIADECSSRVNERGSTSSLVVYWVEIILRIQRAAVIL